MSAIIDHEDIRTVITRAIGANVEIINSKVEAFSENNDGIFGDHQLLTVEVRDRNNDATTQTYFVKAPPKSSIIIDVILDEIVFNEEIQFYKAIQPRLIEYYNNDRWSPRCYLAKSNVMIFEDLRAQGYKMNKDILDEKHVIAGLTTLARFHASTLIAEKRMGKTFKQAYPDAFVEKVYTDKTKCGQFTKVGYGAMIKLFQRFGMDASLVPRIYDRVCDNVKEQKGRCNVVCHGDLWKNNWLYDYSKDPLKSILVDYQLLRYTSPTTDIGMFLYLNTTPEFRKKSETRMLQHYYKVFSDTILCNDREIRVPTYESIAKDYDDLKLVGLTYAALYMPGVYMKDEDVHEIMNNPASLEKWFFHNRYDFILSNINTNPNYEEKIKIVMRELMEAAVRILDN